MVGELSLTSFSALVGRPVATVRAWLEAGQLPGRRTERHKRWRIDASVVAKARAGEFVLPDGAVIVTIVAVIET
jgi:hypothetical protein